MPRCCRKSEATKLQFGEQSEEMFAIKLNNSASAPRGSEIFLDLVRRTVLERRDYRHCERLFVGRNQR